MSAPSAGKRVGSRLAGVVVGESSPWSCTGWCKADWAL